VLKKQALGPKIIKCNKHMKKVFAWLSLAASLLTGFAYGIALPTAASAAVSVCSEQNAHTINLVSSVQTQTAGFLDSVTAPTPTSALNPVTYSHGSLVAATPTQPVIPPWVDPATDPNFTGSGAVWISTDATWPGGLGNAEGNPNDDQWRLFQDGFTIPAGATVTSASLVFTADNAADVYLNGTQVGTTDTSTDDVYGAVPAGLPFNFSNVFTNNIAMNPATGSNTLAFVVRNWGGNFNSNPTGLVYKASINYCLPSSVKVTLIKYIDNKPATAGQTSANGASFPMTATWSAQNIGAGSGSFTLGPVGFNNPSPYQATTSDMTPGASYTAVENLPTTCDAGNAFALVGYTSGATEQEAAQQTPSQTPPNFTNLTGDQFILVWNKTCPPPVLLKVHILKYLDNQKADATSAAGYQFPMIATWQTANLNGGVSTSGNYVLGNNHGGAADQYGADTAPMQAPANYTTSEITSGDSKVLPIGAVCRSGMYRLVGYSTSSVSFADAATKPLTAIAPVFAGLNADQYVIVWNENCDRTVTVNAWKVVCQEQENLPNWGTAANPKRPSAMTQAVIQNFVTKSKGECKYAKNWNFQWGFSNAPMIAGNFIGPTANPAWMNFDTATGTSSPATLTLHSSDLLNPNSGNLWVREVLQTGYIPFTDGSGSVAHPLDKSAELFCSKDGFNYDNYDRIDGPLTLGSTYTCVAINAPIHHENDKDKGDKDKGKGDDGHNSNQNPDHDSGKKS
jgi:hypothetical protein